MITIKQVLMEKGGQVWTITPETTIRQALKLMAEKDVGALVVVDDGKVSGIFSERDYARGSALDPCIMLDQPVSSVMTKKIYYVSPEQTIDECMALMTQKHFRHLPVIDQGQLAGVISIGDVVKSVITERDVTIRGLENFILGREYSG